MYRKITTYLLSCDTPTCPRSERVEAIGDARPALPDDWAATIRWPARTLEGAFCSYCVGKAERERAEGPVGAAYHGLFGRRDLDLGSGSGYFPTGNPDHVSVRFSKPFPEAEADHLRFAGFVVDGSQARRDVRKIMDHFAGLPASVVAALDHAKRELGDAPRWFDAGAGMVALLCEREAMSDAGCVALSLDGFRPTTWRAWERWEWRAPT